MEFLKNVVYLISKILLKTFHKKKYYERSPSKAIVPYMNKNKIQVHDDKFEEWLTANQDKLKKVAKYISEHSSIETISAKNLKVGSLEERKDKK
nr:MAG TPA: hypothetical protein [Caudoviricetes sp.]